ncbi:MAG TPA: glycosyltransferase family 4 protein [Blastocatellia bacterium]|nr:glycosyltransferase family 4 protein [Blastocatellia bacterium]
MNILYITAGAAGMYCGSCLRDNALATELIRLGHDVTLLPLYTPTLTDEPNVSSEKTFFGGISVYLEQRSPIFRHTPRWLDKIWDSQLALKAASKRSIAVDPDSLSELTISILKGERGNQGKEIGKLVTWLKTQPAPDVVDMQNSMLIGLARPIKEATGSPVCCTLQGEDLFLDGMREPYHSQALDLIHEHAKYVDAFIAVSRYYADFMAGYLGIPREKIHVVPLGLNLKDYEGLSAPLRPRDNGKFTIGYFARIAPEKGLRELAEAYRLLRKRDDFPPARLEVAGYLAPEHKGYLREVEKAMQEWGYAGEFHYHGALEREAKLRFFQKIDALSIPTTYAEAKGLSVLEAMASGVPVVQPAKGSFPEILERTGGGLLCEPNDAASLAEAIYSLWKNPELANDLAKRGAAGVREHYSVSQMASRALEVYANLKLTTRSNLGG